MPQINFEITKIHTVLLTLGIIIVVGWNGFRFFHEATEATKTVATLSATLSNLSSTVEGLSVTINEQAATIAALQAIITQERETAKLESYIISNSSGIALNPIQKNEFCQLLKKYRGTSCEM